MQKAQVIDKMPAAKWAQRKNHKFCLQIEKHCHQCRSSKTFRLTLTLAQLPASSWSQFWSDFATVTPVRSSVLRYLGKRFEANAPHETCKAFFYEPWTHVIYVASISETLRLQTWWDGSQPDDEGGRLQLSGRVNDSATHTDPTQRRTQPKFSHAHTHTHPTQPRTQI